MLRFLALPSFCGRRHPRLRALRLIDSPLCSPCQQCLLLLSQATLWLHWAHLGDQEGLPISKSLITSTKTLLLCKMISSSVLENRMWTSLRGHYSIFSVQTSFPVIPSQWPKVCPWGHLRLLWNMEHSLYGHLLSPQIPLTRSISFIFKYHTFDKCQLPYGNIKIICIRK